MEAARVCTSLVGQLEGAIAQLLTEIPFGGGVPAVETESLRVAVGYDAGRVGAVTKSPRRAQASEAVLVIDRLLPFGITGLPEGTVGLLLPRRGLVTDRTVIPAMAARANDEDICVLGEPHAVIVALDDHRARVFVMTARVAVVQVRLRPVERAVAVVVAVVVEAFRAIFHQIDRVS